MPSPTPPHFSASVSAGSHTTVLTIEGEVDLATADDFAAALAAAREESLPVVVDLRECPFMDSTGLQRLLHHRDEAHARGHRTALVYQDPGVIARIVTLVAPGLFETASSVDAAQVALSAPAAVDEPA